MSKQFALAVVVVALLTAAMAGNAAADNHDNWSDPAGDAAGVPDLTKISAQSDDAGNVTFNLAYGNRAILGADDRVVIYVDTDNNDSTGTSGFDYGIALFSGETDLKRWDGAWVDAPSTTLSSSLDGRSVTVNRSELGNSTKLRLQVAGDLLSDPNAPTDWAPDAANRVYVYWLVGPRVDHLVTIAGKKPQAGTTFAVVVPLAILESGAAVPVDTLACVGRLDGTPLPTRVNSPLSCAWRLPKTAHGKRLVYTIAVTKNGMTTTFGPYIVRIN